MTERHSDQANIPSRGLVYCAIGETFVLEAVSSIKQAKRFNSELGAFILTDNINAPQPFDHHACFADVSEGYRAKILACLNTPFQKNVFLDTDTYVSGTLTELYELLDYYDFAAAHATRRYTPSTRNLPGHLSTPPIAFPEFNSGVLAFNWTPHVKAMFESWLYWYDEFHKYGIPQDQPSLRQSVYFSQLRHTVLPNEYNFRTPFPTSFDQEIKILHGRLSAKIAPRLLNRLNKRLGPRVYLPAIGIVHGQGPTIRFARSLQNKAYRIFQRFL